ncbi:hypothetical protein D3C80_2095120 [compost metagenome]
MQLGVQRAQGLPQAAINPFGKLAKAFAEHAADLFQVIVHLTVQRLQTLALLLEIMQILAAPSRFTLGAGDHAL